MDQSFSQGSIQSEGYCSNSILQNCLRNTGCAKDYRDVFLQTAKRLGAQKTALLSLANLAAEQAGKSGGNNIRHWTNVVHIITALGKYSRAQAVAHSAHTAAAPSSDKSSSGPAAAAAAIVVIVSHGGVQRATTFCTFVVLLKGKLCMNRPCVCVSSDVPQDSKYPHRSAP